MLKRSASLLFVTLAAACTGGVSLGKAPSASTPGAGDGVDGSTATGPWGITCTTYWRKSGSADDLAAQKFTAKSDATAKQTIVYADATVDFALAPAPDAPDTEALLTVTTPTEESTQTYRISRTRRPVAQFAGGHGFTGLVYVGKQDLQYVCEADGATPPTRQESPVPLDVVCQVELRTTPGGTVEKRETLTYAPDIGGTSADKSQSLDYEGDVAFTLSGSDSAIDGRSVRVGIGRDPMIPSGAGGVRQLYQLDRNAVLLNQLVGASFTGRVALTTGTNKELSYTCSARSSTAGGDDPSCNTHSNTATREDLPEGACTVAGATCAFQAGSAAWCNKPNTRFYPTTPAEYNCACTDGTWHCDVSASGKGLSTCPGAEPGATCSNGRNTCDVTGCASDEVCFTQVSCGPAGNPTCTLGSSARADNTCHRSCADSSTCPTGQECVKKQFFACSDFDGPTGGRGICCLKGSNCE